MNTAIISIGSNENSETNIKLCQEALGSLFCNIYFSDTNTTSPYGEHYQNDFLNQLVLIKTNLPLGNIQNTCKKIEVQLGRKKEDKKQGLIKIDIDVVKWNDAILKQEDWQRIYIVELLPSLMSRYVIE